tara:strand:- start:248 stop:493 length:246 start_codon:yes stop_codon:yes gene_type:complete
MCYTQIMGSRNAARDSPPRNIGGPALGLPGERAVPVSPERGFDAGRDSRKAEQTFVKANAFAIKLRGFFLESEIERLSEIQ